jgi:hypothetical protein
MLVLRGGAGAGAEQRDSAEGGNVSGPNSGSLPNNLAGNPATAPSLRALALCFRFHRDIITSISRQTAAPTRQLYGPPTILTLPPWRQSHRGRQHFRRYRRQLHRRQLHRRLLYPLQQGRTTMTMIHRLWNSPTYKISST